MAELEALKSAPSSASPGLLKELDAQERSLA